jgi:hypothetical protein
MSGAANNPGPYGGLPNAQPQPVQAADGSWSYPYVAAPAPNDMFVPAAQLDQNVVVPVQARPLRMARDPRRTTMAAVITFVSLIIGLWAVLSFLGSMSKTLSSVAAGTASVHAQLELANQGMTSLDAKTGSLTQMRSNTDQLAAALTGIDAQMGSMVTGVDTIQTGMSSMHGSLGQLGTQVDGINTINAGMAPKLTTINAGLKHQVKQVTSLRGDVVSTRKVLSRVPARLDVTNSRLAWINQTINFFGCSGLTNQIHIKLNFAGLGLGSADIGATITPKGSWGTNQDGTPCL